jgi:hypothetical protein
MRTSPSFSGGDQRRGVQALHDSQGPRMVLALGMRQHFRCCRLSRPQRRLRRRLRRRRARRRRVRRRRKKPCLCSWTTTMLRSSSRGTTTLPTPKTHCRKRTRRRAHTSATTAPQGSHPPPPPPHGSHLRVRARLRVRVRAGPRARAPARACARESSPTLIAAGGVTVQDIKARVRSSPLPSSVPRRRCLCQGTKLSSSPPPSSPVQEGILTLKSFDCHLICHLT